MIVIELEWFRDINPINLIHNCIIYVGLVIFQRQVGITIVYDVVKVLYSMDALLGNIHNSRCKILAIFLYEWSSKVITDSQFISGWVFKYKVMLFIEFISYTNNNQNVVE